MKTILMRKIIIVTILLTYGALAAYAGTKNRRNERMMYSDSLNTGAPMSKDPHVVFFKGTYLMYYSMPPSGEGGWNIGIARSEDLIHWKRTGEILPAPGLEYERKGFCAPCARVIDGRVHLFYQTYGNGRKDAICHAISDDGINFVRDASNPIFSPPESEWSCGRAIDAEVYKFKGRYFLYFSTRDTQYVKQIPGVAVAPGNTDFSRGDWKMAKNEPVLMPELDWEKNCIEGCSVIEKFGRLFMFYAGAYNNEPQQIGAAVSDDGVNWTRLWKTPFLKNGEPGTWNSSESGHPHIFEDKDGRTYLFFQGNNTNGKTWYISNVELLWVKGLPVLSE